MAKAKKEVHVRYGCWGLLPAHVLKLRPQWSEQQALDWLNQHQHTIAKIMEQIGWEQLAALLDEQEDNDEQ